ncbi:MAG: hypothetical protein JO051_08545 [Acidobacteriaceae bacterium]|nr:hypothetical protein [Acidobacteriaceae bacterium]
MGTAVHAASFIRGRRIVLESGLLRHRRLLRLILVHELFHFVWARLSNRKRAEYSHLLAQEFLHGARGELGESSGLKKAARPKPGTRAWRDYVCESFCDSAAFVYSRINRHHAITLAQRWRQRRRRWFEATFAARCGC